MITLTISESCATELRRALAIEQPDSPRPTPPVTPTSPAPPPSTPAGDWQARAREAAARQGYGRVILWEWDWSQGGIVFDTAYKGEVATRGVFIASFVATGAEDSVLAQIDAIGYPAPTQSNRLTMSLSTESCDFTVSEPAISISEAPTLAYCVGTPPRRWWDGKATAVGLVPGVRYFINVTGRDSYEVGKFGGPEFRVALRVPSGH
jgi:hypothetical protein